ncbi:MAG: hypothetical protein ACKOD9_07530, partial [Rubrivivax sp.]
MRALIQAVAAEAGAGESGGGLGRPWSTVLVVGAGGCSEWGALRRLQARRLVLVEPQPRLAEDLARLVRSEPRAQVWPLALVPQGEQATLHLLTMARESGTSAPAALSLHYPRITLLQPLVVPARPMAGALRELALDADERHLLVLDTPGQALALVQAAEPGQLQAFDTLIIRLGAEPLYESDASAQALIEQLQALGFDAIQEDAEALYPHTAWRFERNLQQVQLLQLQALARDTQAQLLQAQERLAVQAEALAQAQSNLDHQHTVIQALQDQEEAHRQQLVAVQATCDALAYQLVLLARQRIARGDQVGSLLGQTVALAYQLVLLARQRIARGDEV